MDSIEKLVNDLYKSEEDAWNNIVRAYNRPVGAPVFLDRFALMQWHRDKNTGIKDPDDIEGRLVKITISDRKVIFKRFITENSANSFINKLLKYEIRAEITSSGGLLL